MPLTQIIIKPQHVTSLHPTVWRAEIEGTDHTLAGRHRQVNADTCRELWSLIETAHHDMFPEDEPLMPLEAVMNHVDESIETSGERVDELVSQAFVEHPVAMAEMSPGAAEQIPPSVLEHAAEAVGHDAVEHAQQTLIELEELREQFPDPSDEDDPDAEQPVHVEVPRRPRGRPRK